MRRTITDTIHRSMRGSLSLLLMGGLLLRPAQLDAILIHSHGDDGGHVHALSRSDIALYQQEHDRLHEIEHTHVSVNDHLGDGAATIHDRANHSEECGAILVVFGEMKGATASPRFDVAKCHGQLETTSPALEAPASLLTASHYLPKCLLAPDSAPSHPLDTLLQSSHAILI